MGAGIILMVIGLMLLSGCTDVKTPSAHYALTHPLSTKTMVVLGTSKEEVIEKWGEPNEIVDVGVDDTGLKKETWIYEAWFPGVPLDHKHFSRRKKIYFVGDYVTGYKDIESGDKDD